MAITKIHSVKSTLDKAIAYICDPAKTDDKLLIHTNNCAAETAYIEFEMTRRLGTNQGENLAHHLIQAFEPGEVTPEQAHEIGIKLIDELLKGKFEYVLATHVDKNHVHNHIIFNAVNYENFKTYETEKNRNKSGYWKIRSINDKLCAEYGLSVIKNAEKGKGKSHYEWQQFQQGSSWKSRLKSAIDDTIQSAKSFEDFLYKMEKRGYKFHDGKHIAFLAQGQERPTRVKRLGWYYEEAQIVERIRRQNKGLSKLHKNPLIKEDKLGKLVNLKENSPKALERWAIIHNMQEASKALNLLAENGLESLEDLHDSLYSKHEQILNKATDIKAIENDINTVSQRLKNLKIYKKYKPIADKYEKSLFKDKFMQEHELELMQFELALDALKKSEKGNKLPSVDSLTKRRSSLYNAKNKLYEEYKDMKNDLKKYENIKNNIEQFLHKKEKNRSELE